MVFVKVFTMLGLIIRLSFEFRYPHTLYTSLLRPKLEYASCVWNSIYDARVDKVEGVHNSQSIHSSKKNNEKYELEV
jgi:hypothetical protein